MFDWLRQLLAPPVFEDDEDKTRAARLLNLILWVNIGIWVLSFGAMPLAENPWVVILILGALILLGGSMLALMRRGRVRLAGSLLSVLLWLAVTSLLFISGGVQSLMILGYVVVTIVAALVLGGRAGFVFGGLSIVAAGIVLVVELLGFLPAALVAIEPVSSFSMFVGNIAAVAALLYVAVGSLNEALDRARRNAAELDEARAGLEKTVAERTRDLARRARYLEATASVGHDAVSVLDLQELLTRVVQSISEQFEFYHTGLFLLDTTGQWAELRAASSEGGRHLQEGGHRLRVGREGIVGYVTGHDRARIALDVGDDAVHFDNPYLPATRSEMALPLRSRGEVIGALDVQSTEPAAFSEEDIAVLQSLADQVALAINNARLFEQVQESMAAERRAYGQLSRQAWLELTRLRPDLGYRYRRDRVERLEEDALEEGVSSEALPEIRLPIRYRGLSLGSIVAHKPQGVDWTSEERELVASLADQLSLALDSARLYEDTQRRAAQEQMMADLTARIRESLDVDTVLQTAVREMRQALDAAEVEVHLGAEEL